LPTGSQLETLTEVIHQARETRKLLSTPV